jgi:hypothetical protein
MSVKFEYIDTIEIDEEDSSLEFNKLKLSESTESDKVDTLEMLLGNTKPRSTPTKDVEDEVSKERPLGI